MPTATAMVRKIPNSICYVIELKLINHWILKILHLLEPTFQEKYSQVAWSGKHSEYTVTRFIFQNLVLLKICSFLGYTSSLTPNIA